MSGQRISLTRIIAVNWYGFRQIIDVANHTLVAGAFGSGKSALLDLIQCVMLGENWRPNRAAAGNARGRSLVSYCLCDTNTVRGGEPHYIRRSGVTLVGLEFSWPAAGKEAPRRETWGIRIEYAGPTAEPKRTYFLIPERLQWADIAPNGEMMDEDQFRSMLRREHGREAIFAGPRDYLAEMATPRHLWFDFEQFRKTFPKAIAFEVEDNVERFIREFILEESPVDVRDVRAAVGAYRDTQSRLERQQEEAALLRAVCEENKLYENALRETALAKHLARALERARLGELVERHERDLAALREKHAQDNAAFDRAASEKERIETALREFQFDSDDGDLSRRQSEQKSKRAEQARILETQNSVRQRLRDLRLRWASWLKRAGDLKLENLPSATAIDDRLLETLGQADEAKALESLPLLAERFDDIFRAVAALLEPHKREIQNMLGRLREIAADLDRLEKGQTAGTFPLFETIKARLSNSPAPPEQLCRLIEVKANAEDWRQALELALGRNRFAIVVGSPEDFHAALDVLRKRHASERGVDESIIHPREAAELPGEAKANSLADKIEFTRAAPALRKIAEQFARHLLGRTMAVERAEDLDLVERGITRDGIFKQAPTRRRLRQQPGFEHTIGAEGLKRLRADLTREQQGVMAQQKVKQGLIESVNQWLDNGKAGGLGDRRLPDGSAELARLPALEKELSSLAQQIEILSTPERAARLKKWEGLQADLGRANQLIGSLQTTRAAFAQNEKVLLEARAAALEDRAAAHDAMIESRIHLPSGIIDAEINERLAQHQENFKTWADRKDHAHEDGRQSENEASEAKHRRHTQRRALMDAVDGQGRLKHPEYRHDFDPDEDNNSRWQARLDALNKVHLEESKRLAAERKKEWERRLKDQVLNRLNENLQASERAIRQLRGYLDVRVGQKKYRISQERDPAYSSAWSLLNSGFEPTDELLAGARDEGTQNALNELMAAVESDGAADARGLSLLDYRNYHRYDIRVRPADRADAPEISLSRSGRSLSGGENQAPFFISMLAAFRRVYDLGSGRSQHLGLVVMDEAFSKLSGDGVEDCLELARNFNLQLLMAFPIDRLGVMAPYADTVVEIRKEEVHDASGFVAQLDNIPIVLPPEEVQSSLA